MINSLLFALTFASALGCGLIAGSFFAFSTFVMGALGRLPPAHGIAAMQSINVVVINPWFLGAFIGTAVACALLVAATLLNWQEPGAMAPACGRLALCRRHVSGDDAVQRPSQRRAGGGGAGQPRWGKPVEPVSQHLDGLEPCAHDCGPCRSRQLLTIALCVQARGSAWTLGDPAYRLSQRLAKPSRPWGMKITMRMKMMPDRDQVGNSAICGSRRRRAREQRENLAQQQEEAGADDRARPACRCRP